MKDEDPRRPGGTELPRHERLAKVRVLVIDDDRSVGAAIQMILAHQEYDTVIVADAHAGIQALEASKFDVVMIDIFMPGPDGLETIKDIRERKATVPIIAMSGFKFRKSVASTPDFLGMAAKLGATVCLRKPFAPQQLMAAINSCLDPALSIDRSAESRNDQQGKMR